MAILDLKPHIGFQPVWDNNPLAIPVPELSILGNEGTGGMAFDTSNNSNHGIWNGTGAHWAGGAMQFNGSDDYIDISSIWNNFPDDGTPFTISVRVNLSDVSGQKELVDIGDGADETGFRIVSVDRNLIGQIMDGTTRYTVSASNVLSANVWLHIAFTYDGTNKTLYLNGEEVATNTGGDWRTHTVAYIGQQADGTARFSGLMEGVLISNESLSPAQMAFISANPYYAWDYLDDTLITILAAQEQAIIRTARSRIVQPKPRLALQPVWDNNPLAIPAPVGAWIMNEGTGDKAFDLSGNGNDGTFDAAVSWGTGFVEIGGTVDNGILLSSEYGAGDLPDWTVISEIYCNVLPSNSKWVMVGDTVSNYGIQAFSAKPRAYLNGTDRIVANTSAIQDAWETWAFTHVGGEYAVYKNANLDNTNSTTAVELRVTKIGSFDRDNGALDGRLRYTYIYNKALSPAQIAFISANPYYAWDYLDDTLITIIAAQAPPAGVVPQAYMIMRG